MSDAELIGRVLDGERDFFQALVHRYQDMLYRVAYTIVLDEETAADMVQDAFIRAYTSLARCRDRRRFRVWLLATLRHRALDHLRERRRRDASLSDDAVRREAEARAAEADFDAGERHVLRRELDTALLQLSEPLREAFVLRHIEQCPYDEIAELLAITVSAAKMRVQRARTLLREWLEPDVTGRGVQTS